MKYPCERCSRPTKVLRPPRADSGLGGLRRKHKCPFCGHEFETHQGSRGAVLKRALKMFEAQFGAQLTEFREQLAELRRLTQKIAKK